MSAAPTSASPTWPAPLASPAKPSTGISPAPTRCSSRPPYTLPTTSRTVSKRISSGITDPVEAVAEGIATALEWLPKDKHLGLLIVPGRPNPHIESVTGDVSLDFGYSMVRRFDVDWAGLGFSDDDLRELAEHLLRIIQSFVIDPGRPPRTGEDLRRYLRRWVGSAVGIMEH